mmetsp:Transcript_21087/g.41792  ORF Transcript_21087/g.41792 Transcript_21087/m.41792 type:complete len:143 (+) Transcript_21087:85-513(+)
MDAAGFRSVYRQLFHLSSRIPTANKRPEAINLVRQRFREHRGTDDVAALSSLMAEAESRLGFLKMMTPRSFHRSALGEGSGRTLYHGGEKIDADGAHGLDREAKAKWSNWTGSNLDPDMVAQHSHSLKRAGFKDNYHAKGFF